MCKGLVLEKEFKESSKDGILQDSLNRMEIQRQFVKLGRLDNVRIQEKHFLGKKCLEEWGIKGLLCRI